MCVCIYSVYKNMHVLSAWLFVNFKLIAYYKFQSLIYSLVHVFVHACVNIGITTQKVRQKSITHLEYHFRKYLRHCICFFFLLFLPQVFL